MAQEQTKRGGGGGEDDGVSGSDAGGQERREKLAAETDDLLDEIDDVLETVQDLTAKHIGALIVFSRADHISVTVDTGITLNAQVSSELLSSIFNPRSPLHDGAVIVDNQTVVAARCVLPLSSTQRIGTRNLGTRHRAGLGLSEQADVVVLIVSEERGAISLAYQGELMLDIDPNELRVLLQDRLTEISAG